MALIANSLPVQACCSPGHFLLVNDRIAASGEFILHHVLSATLKESTAACVLLSFNQSLEHWKTIQSKMGVTLATHIARKAFVFVDGFSQISMPPTASASPTDPLMTPPVDPSTPTPLRPIFNAIVHALQSVDASSPKVLLIDEISLLEWLGVPQSDLLRFWRGILALKQKMNFGLVVLQSLDAVDGNVGERPLLSSCNIHVEVSPLASGRSSAVTGEVTLQRGPMSHPDDTSFRLGHKRALQYRLTDNGAIWIERGTGGGML